MKSSSDSTFISNTVPHSSMFTFMFIHSVLVTITSSEDGESKDDNDEPAEEVNKNVLPPAEDPYMLVRNKKKAEESMEQTPHLRASEEEEEDNDASESKEDKNEESNDISPNTIEDHLTVMNKKSETEESEEEEKSPLDSIDNSSLNNDLGDKANPDEFITSKSNESEEETKDMPSKNTDDNDLPAVSKNEEEEEDKPKTEEENILNESEVNNKESERPSIDSSSEPEGEENYQTLTSITVPASKEDRSYLSFPPLNDLSIVKFWVFVPTTSIRSVTSAKWVALLLMKRREMERESTFSPIPMKNPLQKPTTRMLFKQLKRSPIWTIVYGFCYDESGSRFPLVLPPIILFLRRTRVLGITSK